MLLSKNKTHEDSILQTKLHTASSITYNHIDYDTYLIIHVAQFTQANIVHKSVAETYVLVHQYTVIHT